MHVQSYAMATLIAFVVAALMAAQAAPMPPDSADAPALSPSTGVTCDPSHDAPRLQPVLEDNVMPPYPALAMRLGEQGTTKLRITVGKDGIAKDIELTMSSGSERLDQAAIQFVKTHWHWTPPTFECRPVEITTPAQFIWKIRNATNDLQVAFAQAHRILATMGYLSSDQDILAGTQNYESEIFQKVTVSPDDRDRARQILLDANTKMTRDAEDDLAKVLGAYFPDHFSSQQIEGAIHFYETPLGSKMAHRQSMSDAEKKELGTAVFANPAILRVQTVAVSIMLGAVGKDFAGNQQQREEKLTRAFCAGLVQANISQSGCSDTATLVTTSNVSKVESSDTPFYDVFKKFCGDPKADPDLVRAQLSGAPEAKLLPTIKLPGSLSVDIWAVNWESHKYTIESEKLSANPGDNPLMIACAVRNSSATEDASVAALEKWVGIPSDKSNLALDEKLDRTNYFYHEEGSTRTAIEDGPGSSNPGLSALPNIWSFRIQDHNTHVQLLHFTGKSPSPAPAK